MLQRSAQQLCENGCSEGEGSEKGLLNFAKVFMRQAVNLGLTAIEASELMGQFFFDSKENANPKSLGELLASCHSPFTQEQWQQIRTSFFSCFDLFRLPFVRAMRVCLDHGGFRPPSEPLRLSRVLNGFVQAYCKQNPKAFEDAALALRVALAVLVLNSEYHTRGTQNESVIKVDGFIAAITAGVGEAAVGEAGTAEAANISRSRLEAMYKDVVDNPIIFAPLGNVELGVSFEQLQKDVQRDLRNCDNNWKWEPGPEGSGWVMTKLLQHYLMKAFNQVGKHSCDDDVLTLCVTGLTNLDLLTSKDAKEGTIPPKKHINDFQVPITFNDVFENPSSKALFRKYVTSSFDDESLRFLEAAMEFQEELESVLGDSTEALAKARQLVSQFIAPGSESEINISSSVRFDIVDKINAATANSLTGTEFLRAVRDITRLVENNSFARWVETPEFFEWYNSRETLTDVAQHIKHRQKLVDVARKMLQDDELMRPRTEGDTKYNAAATAIEIVEWLVANMASSNKSALKMGQSMVDAGLLISASGGARFQEVHHEGSSLYFPRAHSAAEMKRSREGEIPIHQGFLWFCPYSDETTDAREGQSNGHHCMLFENQLKFRSRAEHDVRSPSNSKELSSNSDEASMKQTQRTGAISLATYSVAASKQGYPMVAAHPRHYGFILKVEENGELKQYIFAAPDQTEQQGWIRALAMVIRRRR